jgi:hypothetical protein
MVGRTVTGTQIDTTNPSSLTEDAQTINDIAIL